MGYLGRLDLSTIDSNSHLPVRLNTFCFDTHSSNLQYAQVENANPSDPCITQVEIAQHCAAGSDSKDRDLTKIENTRCRSDPNLTPGDSTSTIYNTHVFLSGFVLNTNDVTMPTTSSSVSAKKIPSTIYNTHTQKAYATATEPIKIERSRMLLVYEYTYKLHNANNTQQNTNTVSHLSGGQYQPHSYPLDFHKKQGGRVGSFIGTHPPSSQARTQGGWCR